MEKEELKHTIEEHISKPKSKAWIFLSIGGVACILMVSALLVYAKSYEERTIPGLMIRDISLGKMNSVELKDFLTTMSDKLVSDGLEFQIQHTTGTYTFTVLPELVTEGSVVDYVTIDTQKEADRLLHYKKEGNLFLDAFHILKSHLNPQEVNLAYVTVDRDRLKKTIQEKAKPYEQLPVNADLDFQSFEPLKYTFTSSAPGFIFHYDAAIDTVESNWKHLKTVPIVLESEKTEPSVKESDFAGVISSLPQYLDLGPLVLQYAPQDDAKQEWKIPVSTFAEWLTVEKNQQASLQLVLDVASSTRYLEKVVGSDINVEPQNAKFSIQANGKVQEFQAARVGLGVDVTSTVQAMQVALADRKNATTTPVQIMVTEVKPDVSTDQVNDLGIKEVLGVGVSSFAGSPPNRVKNIKNAVIKLNGTLIKPGDEFSAIKYTEPYTIEGGYLPEKVIKGDEIKPEIGGGLCQVGTTLFRMAMNGGMEITERRNHSLVVNYYNDPSNGLPGTDATIYDPAPDFRFKNDTNNYILIETSINEKTGDLRFTLWGTSDGRKASYSKPVVHKWAPSGSPRMIETTNLPPGKKECQNAFRGATASFTYTRVMPDGTTQDRLFESYYRPLPQICLVGVDKAAPACAEGEECSQTPAPDAPASDTPAPVVAPVVEKPSETAPFESNT